MSLARAGKKKSVPKFEEVGNINTNVDTNTKTKDEPEVEVKPEVVAETKVENKPEVIVENPIESIINTVIKKPKEKPKRQISVYLDEDVAKAFEQFGKKHGKGAKSELVNNFLRTALNVNKK
jgi:uncharacterized protein (DUF4415 family)